MKSYYKLKNNLKLDFTKCIEIILDDEIRKNEQYKDLEIVQIINSRTGNSTATDITDNERQIFVKYFEKSMSSQMIDDDQLLFVIYCWVLNDKHLQRIMEHLESKIENNFDNFLSFLERSINEFEFQTEMYKIFLNLLISYLVKALNKGRLLLIILKLIHKMTGGEVLNYFTEKTNLSIIDFFGKIFKEFECLVNENINVDEDLIIHLSNTIDKYFIYLQKEEYNQQTNELFRSLDNCLKEKTDIKTYFQLRFILFKVLLKINPNDDNHEEICKSFIDIYYTFLEINSKQLFAHSEFLEFVNDFVSDKREFLNFIQLNRDSKFFIEFINNLTNTSNQRVKIILTNLPDPRFKISVSIALGRFLNIRNGINKLKLGNECNELKTMVNDLSNDEYVQQFKVVFLTLLDLSHISFNNPEKTRIYSYAISYLIKLYPLERQENNEFLETIIKFVSEVENKTLEWDNEMLLRMIVEIPKCLLSKIPSSFRDKEIFTNFLANSSTNIIQWIKRNKNKILLTELVEFASTCCLMDKGIMLRNAIENYYTTVDDNCRLFLEYLISNSNDLQIQQNFQHFLNEDNNHFFLPWEPRDVNEEEAQSIQNESNESNNESLIVSEDDQSIHNERESKRVDFGTSTASFSKS